MKGLNEGYPLLAGLTIIEIYRCVSLLKPPKEDVVQGGMNMDSVYPQGICIINTHIHYTNNDKFGHDK
jgi:hypothetical protein